MRRARAIRSCATRPGRAAPTSAAVCCATAAAAAAKRALQALGEERADDPGEDVARAGGRERRRAGRRDEHALPGAATSVSAPLSRTTQPKRSTRAAHGLEPVRVDPRRLLAEQPRELARVRRQHGRRGRARTARARRARRRRRPRAARARSSSRRDELPRVAAAEPRPDRERARPLRTPSNAVLQRPLDRLEQPRLEHRQRLSRRGDGDVAGVGAERGHGGEARGAGQPARAADDEHRARACTCCRRAAARGTSAQDVARDERVLVSRRARARCRRPDRRRRGSARARRPGRPSGRGTSPSCAARDGRARRPRRSTRRRPKGRRPRRRDVRAAFIRSISAAASVARLAVEAGAEERVEDDVGAVEVVRLLGVATGLPQQARARSGRRRRSCRRRRRGDPPRRREQARAPSSATARPARSISSSTSCPASAARISSAV